MSSTSIHVAVATNCLRGGPDRRSRRAGRWQAIPEDTSFICGSGTKVLTFDKPFNYYLIVLWLAVGHANILCADPLSRPQDHLVFDDATLSSRGPHRSGEDVQTGK